MIRNGLIAFAFILTIVSCSKEEDEVPLASPNVSAENFDGGHLLIMMEGSAGVVDSIIYTNETKGFSNKINLGGLGYTVSNNKTILTKPLYDGSDNDQVRCCVYLNSPTEIGIAFDTTYSTLQTLVSPAGTVCESGTY